MFRKPRRRKTIEECLHSVGLARVFNHKKLCDRMNKEALREILIKGNGCTGTCLKDNNAHQCRKCLALIARKAVDGPKYI